MNSTDPYDQFDPTKLEGGCGGMLYFDLETHRWKVKSLSSQAQQILELTKLVESLTNELASNYVRKDQLVLVRNLENTQDLFKAISVGA